MKRLQRKISVALIKGSPGLEENLEDINLTEAPTKTNAADDSPAELGGVSTPPPPRRHREKDQLRRVKTMSDGHNRSPSRKQRQKAREPPPSAPTCEICYNDFTQPKLLPCQHTFCQLCLEKFVNPKLMVECPTCRKETQLSVLGVASLPDNQKVGGKVKTAEEISSKEGGRRISLSGLNLGDPLNMKRQLQISFSKLDTTEHEFHGRMEELSTYIDQAIEEKISDLTRKRTDMKTQLKEALKEKVERHERWRKTTGDLIDNIEDLNEAENGSDGLNKSFSDQLKTLDELCSESISFDPVQVRLKFDDPKSCPVAVPQTRLGRKMSRKVEKRDSILNILTPFTPEFYRAAVMDEVRKIRWAACLQPRCARLCPWSGHIWVCAAGSREIAIFDTDDSYIQSFSNPGFLFPCSIDFSMETMEAFILDKRQSIIFVVTPTFTVTRSIGKEGRKPGSFSSPSSLILDNKGRLIVSDDGNDRIQILTTDGSFVTYLGVHQQEGVKGHTKELSSPQGLALSLDGKAVAVADSGNNRIRIYSVNSGRQLQCFGMGGKGNGQLEKPVDLSWDPQGHLLVLDEERVQVFTENGAFIKFFKVKEGLNGMQVIGNCVLLYDTYSVNKFILKTR